LHSVHTTTQVVTLLTGICLQLEISVTHLTGDATHLLVLHIEKTLRTKRCCGRCCCCCSCCCQ